jgi:hypothetical protein
VEGEDFLKVRVYAPENFSYPLRTEVTTPAYLEDPEASPTLTSQRVRLEAFSDHLTLRLVLPEVAEDLLTSCRPPLFTKPDKPDNRRSIRRR